MLKNEGVLHEEYYLLSQDIVQIEVMANLDQVSATGSLIIISFPYWEKVTGSPVRAISISS
ncbi:kynurenine formamidase [Streptococcus moroccensis]|uniref:Kynurenine formamidase n=1 Tax=Streptococcus moroccensis TaxID=1451356 RepID=A0ABT9YW24_9STRE|nr:kynurenine formamidase [Streptococcus moroccensis]